MSKNYYLFLILFVQLSSLFQFVCAEEYTVSGYVKSNLYPPVFPPIENVTMTASDGGGITQTNAEGYYNFSLPSGWSGSITPSKDDYTFSPDTLFYSNLTSDSTEQNFMGTYYFELSGYIRTIDGPAIDFPDPVDFTVPLVGVKVCLGDPNEPYNDSTCTDQNGFYYFKIPQGMQGTTVVGCLWPPDLLGCVLSRDFCCMGEIGGDANVDFEVYIVCEGYVEENSGNPINGVTVTAVSDSGDTAVFITEDGLFDGFYCFCTSYHFGGTITPNKPGWEFNPSYRLYSNLLTNQTGQNFIGAPIQSELPDLQCNSAGLAISPTTIVVGNTFNFSGLIENQGAESSGVDFQVNLFICPNPDVLEFGTSCYLGSFMVSALGAGLTSSFDETVTVPLSVTPGTYYVWVSIDPPDTVTESDETNNQQSCSTPLIVNPTGIVSENPQTITHFSMSQNYPNPLNPETWIQYQLPKTSHVILGVYNLMGEEVVRLIDEVKEMGVYSVNWDGRDSQGQYLSSGVYVYQIRAGAFTESKKLILSR